MRVDRSRVHGRRYSEGLWMQRTYPCCNLAATYAPMAENIVRVQAATVCIQAATVFIQAATVYIQAATVVSMAGEAARALSYSGAVRCEALEAVGTSSRDSGIRGLG